MVNEQSEFVKPQVKLGTKQYIILKKLSLKLRTRFTCRRSRYRKRGTQKLLTVSRTKNEKFLLSTLLQSYSFCYFFFSFSKRNKHKFNLTNKSSLDEDILDTFWGLESRKTMEARPGHRCGLVGPLQLELARHSSGYL